MKYLFKDLVDAAKLQELTDELYRTTGIPSAIITVEGEVLTGSGWQRVCTEFFRSHPDAQHKCVASDTSLHQQLGRGEPFAVYECPHHLTDACVPVTIEGEHVANVFCGQLFLQPPDATTEQCFREQARKYGFDEGEFLKAYREIPVMPIERFRSALMFLAHLAQLIANMGLTRKQQLEATEKAQTSQQQFADIINFSPDAIYAINLQGQVIAWNRAMANLTGVPAEEMLGKGNYEYALPFFGQRQPVLIDCVLNPNHACLGNYPNIRQEGDTFLADPAPRTVQGEVRILSGKASPMYDANRQVIGAIGMVFDVTKESFLQALLQANEERFRAVAQTAGDAIISINQQGEIIFWNQAAEQMLGWAKNEITGKPVATIMPEWYRADHPKHVTQALERGHLASPRLAVPLEALHREGDIIPVEVSVSQWKNRDGTYFTAILRDVRERRRLEAERLKAQTQYEMLFREMIDGFALHNIICNEQGQPVDYRFVAVNPAFERLTGLQAAKVIGRTVLEVMPQTEPFWIETYGQVALTGKATQFEHFSQALNRHFEVTAFCPVPHQFATIIVDKTEKHRHEEQLQASEERLQLALQAASLGMWDVDLIADKTIWSESHYRLFGVDPATFVPGIETFFLCIHPADRAGVQMAAEHARINQTEYHHEYRIRWPDGSEHWMLARGHFLYDAQGRATRMLGVAQDITPRKQLEEQYRQSQKVEAIGQLAGGIAHDFNNILGSFMMHLDILHQDLNVTPEIKQALLDLNKEAKRAAGITRQLLLFSRKQAMQARALDLNESVAEILKVLHRLLGEHIELSFTPAPTPMPVEADPGMIEQVIMNLCVNARDAMPDGGPLKLSIRAVNLGNTSTKPHPEYRPGAFACLTVQDAGCGMNAATLKRIFEPFFTTKEPGQGTGLGLATVQSVVKQHKGWVDVTSTVGQGTTFTVYLPLATAKAHPPTVNNNLLSFARGTETILLVEDDLNLRRAARLLLCRLGYQILEAENGVVALELWQKHKDSINLLLTDNNMPKGITGIQLASKLHEERPRLPVIISSGYNMETAGRVLPIMEGTQYLPKPLEPGKLAQAVRDILDKTH
jgi:PAS domain S-box-containing protein